MLSIWLPVVEPTAVPEEVLAEGKLLGPGDVEASEFSIEDDSSSAISGNESPPIGVQESTTSTDASQTVRHRIRVNGIGMDDVDNAVTSSGLLDESSAISSAYPTSDLAPSLPSPTESLPSRSTSPPPKMVHLHKIYQFQFPDNFIRIGCILSVMLVLLSMFLIYRIMNVSNSHSSGMTALHDFGALNAKLVSCVKKIYFIQLCYNTIYVQQSDENIDVYAEVLKWQRQLQSKGADEAQIILNANLESIARVGCCWHTLLLPNVLLTFWFACSFNVSRSDMETATQSCILYTVYDP